MSIVAKSFAFAAAFTVAAVIAATQSHAEDCCDPRSPFTPGEDYPEQPATCENIEYWAERAPNTVARISMAITGKLTAVNSDGALAYLFMCQTPGFEVMCITYSTNGMEPGDRVLFAGGYNRAGEKRVVLDPCLASRECAGSGRSAIGYARKFTGSCRVAANLSVFKKESPNDLKKGYANDRDNSDDRQRRARNRFRTGMAQRETGYSRQGEGLDTGT